MALRDDFYNDIYIREKKCIELIDRNLLNIYYLNGKNGLREFYQLKRQELEEEYKISNNQIIKNIINIINNIIDEIDYLTISYKNGELVDMRSLNSLFLYNLMNNKNNKPNNIEYLQVQRKKLEDLRKIYRNSIDSYDKDYLYDEPDYEPKDYNKKAV